MTNKQLRKIRLNELHRRLKQKQKESCVCITEEIDLVADLLAMDGVFVLTIAKAQGDKT